MGAINNNRNTASERSAVYAIGGGGSLNALYWYLIFALGFIVTNTLQLV